MIPNLLKDFGNEIDQLYKSYRLQHFSLRYMSGTYFNYKVNNPHVTNFVIQDEDFDEVISFSEENMVNEISEYGKYQNVLGGTTIVMFYQLWDDNYRAKIARTIGNAKNEIHSDLFGELNKVRRAIIHNQFNPKDCLGKLNILNFLISDDEKFLLSSLEISQIYHLIKTEIDRLTFELEHPN